MHDIDAKIDQRKHKNTTFAKFLAIQHIMRKYAYKSIVP